MSGVVRGIMDFFGAQASHATSPTSAPPPLPNAIADANPTIPNNLTPISDGKTSAIPAGATGAANPLDAYKDLWQAPKTDPNQPSPPSLTPTFNLDPAKLAEIAGKVDFTGHISPELMKKALEGDLPSLQGIIQGAAQAAFAKSTEATGMIVQLALTNQAKAIEASVPGILHKNNVTAELQKNNALFNNPATKPMLDLVTNQFILKNPTATPTEIEQHAKAFISGFAENVVKMDGKQITEVPKPGKGAKVETDWLKYATQS